MADFETFEQELSSPLPDNRQRAVVGLVETNDLRALPLLERAAKHDPNTKVRFFAKRGILLMRQKSAAAEGQAPGAKPQPKMPDLRALVSRWSTLSVEDRIRALQRLSALGDKMLLPFYTAILRSEKEPFVRSKAVVSIGILGDPAGLPVLKAALQDKDARVRSNAVEAIGYIGGEAALPLVFAALVGPENPRLVQNVQRFLERGNEAAFAGYLRRAFLSSRSAIREAVLKAIGLLDRERLYDVLAQVAREDSGDAGREARAALEAAAAQGKRRARALLDRLAGKSSGEEETTAPGSGQSGLVLKLAGGTEEERLAKLASVIASGDRDMLPHLAAWLRAEKSGKVRSLLVRGIAQLAGDRAVKTLLALLDDSDGRVRADAIECLYPYATDPEVGRRVPGKLADQSGRVRANAIVLLGRIPGYDIQKPLGDLAASEDPQDRLRAIYVMSDVERADATKLVAPLLADPDAQVRARASEAFHVMAENGDETAMKLLAGARPVAPPASLQLDPELDEERPTPAPEPEPKAPAHPPKTLDPASDVAIEHDRLLYSLDSEDESERLQAVRILEEVGDETTIEPVRRLMNDRSETVREHAGRAFRALKDKYGPEGADPIPEAGEDVLEKLRLRLCHREPKMRQAALREIGPAHRELREFLVERVPVEPDPHVRASMVLIAGTLAGPADLPKLVPCLQDEDARVRANTIEALEYAGDPSVVRVIAPFLNDPNQRIRSNAALALRHFDRAKVLAVLTEMAASPDGWQRAAAVLALAELSGPDALPPLYTVVAGEDNLFAFVQALSAIVQVPDAGRESKLRQLQGEIQDSRRKEWTEKAVEALPTRDFQAKLPGAEGSALRLKPSPEDLLAAVKPKARAASASAPAADDDKVLERQKLARMAAHLREDLYSSDSKQRQEAAVKLSRVEHPAAIRVLVVALSHSDTVVKYLARRGLKAMLEKPDIFDVDGDMTHSAVKSAIAKLEKEEASKGPAVGEFNWTLAWAAVLMLMTLLYVLFGRGGSDEPAPPKPRRPRRPTASRAHRPATSEAGAVKLGGGDSSSGASERPKDEPSAAGVVDKSAAPPAEEGAKLPAGGRGEGIRPDDMPSDPSPPSKPKDRSSEPEASVSDRNE